MHCALVASHLAPTHIPCAALPLVPGCSVVDGAMLASFAQAWRSYVENPGRLLLHLR
mgnify:CR=1 FL=1